MKATAPSITTISSTLTHIYEYMCRKILWETHLYGCSWKRIPAHITYICLCTCASLEVLLNNCICSFCVYFALIWNSIILHNRNFFYVSQFVSLSSSNTKHHLFRYVFEFTHPLKLYVYIKKKWKNYQY